MSPQAFRQGASQKARKSASQPFRLARSLASVARCWVCRCSGLCLDNDAMIHNRAEADVVATTAVSIRYTRTEKHRHHTRVWSLHIEDRVGSMHREAYELPSVSLSLERQRQRRHGPPSFLAPTAQSCSGCCLAHASWCRPGHALLHCSLRCLSPTRGGWWPTAMHLAVELSAGWQRHRQNRRCYELQTMATVVIMRARALSLAGGDRPLDMQ